MSFNELGEEYPETTTNGNNDNKTNDTNGDPMLQSDPFIGTIEDCIESHEYHIDNEFIKKGYRIHFNTFWRIMKSLFMLHNELFNVWSHLLGCFTAIILLIISMVCIDSLSLLHKYSTLDDPNEISSQSSNINRNSFNLQNNSNISTFNNKSFDKIIEIQQLISNKSEEYFLKVLNTTKSIKNSNLNLHCLMKIIDKINSNYKENIEYESSILNQYVELDILCISCLEEINNNYNNSLYLLEYYTNKKDFDENQKMKLILQKLVDSHNSPSSSLNQQIDNIDNNNSSMNFLKENIEVNDEIVKEYLNNMYIFLESKINELNKILAWSSQHNDKIQTLVKWPLALFFLGGMCCMGCSATFHLFAAHSEIVKLVFNRLDYAGIALLIVGSCYPPYYYYFLCSWPYMIGYMTFMTIFGLIIIGITMSTHFDKPKYLALKGILFLLLGISAGIAMIHIDFFSDSIGEFPDLKSLIEFYIGGLCYIVGAVIYILRIPERFKPGWFDYIGNSHNIFHCFVLAGFAIHYIGCLKSYDYRQAHSCNA